MTKTTSLYSKAVVQYIRYKSVGKRINICDGHQRGRYIFSSAENSFKGHWRPEESASDMAGEYSEEDVSIVSAPDISYCQRLSGEQVNCIQIVACQKYIDIEKMSIVYNFIYKWVGYNLLENLQILDTIFHFSLLSKQFY